MADLFKYNINNEILKGMEKLEMTIEVNIENPTFSSETVKFHDWCSVNEILIDNNYKVVPDVWISDCQNKITFSLGIKKDTFNNNISLDLGIHYLSFKFNINNDKPDQCLSGSYDEKISFQIKNPDFKVFDSPLKIKLERTTNKATKDILLWGLIKWISEECSFEKFNINLKVDIDLYPNNPENSYIRLKSFEELLKKTDQFLIDKYISFPEMELILQEIKNTFGDIELDSSIINQFINDYLKTSSSSVAEEIITIPYFNTLSPKSSKKPSSLTLPRPVINKNSLVKRPGGKVRKFASPLFLEYIYSYWHEESMLMQAMKVISLRFQNAFSPTTRNQLMNFTIDPLRSLGNILWGYIQNEDKMLSIRRRAYEYDQEYGLKLFGKAVNDIKSVDSRSKFLESFHCLLNLCTIYFKELDDTTIHADAFNVKNALRELHLILAEGANNQYGDLPWTSRVEMYATKWILSQEEVKEFLRGRPMVPYNEPWMGAVDVMKKIQGWNDTSVSHYFELATKGEQILLSIRFGNWNDNDVTSDQAETWAKFWREDIQSYIHAYRVVTGVDLAKCVNYEMPGLLIMRKNRPAKQYL